MVITVWHRSFLGVGGRRDKICCLLLFGNYPDPSPGCHNIITSSLMVRTNTCLCSSTSLWHWFRGDLTIWGGLFCYIRSWAEPCWIRPRAPLVQLPVSHMGPPDASGKPMRSLPADPPPLHLACWGLFFLSLEIIHPHHGLQPAMDFSSTKKPKTKKNPSSHISVHICTCQHKSTL